MKNNFEIVDEQLKDKKIMILVDTSKSILRGMAWNQLGEWGKRKFENMLVLQRWEKEKTYVKVNYV